MGLLDIFNKKTKQSSSEISNIPEEQKQYTEEEIAFMILQELGVSNVIISNPTAIYQLKEMMLRLIRDNIGIAQPTLKYNKLSELISLMRKFLKVLPDGGVEFDVYEYYNDSTYQVERPNGQLETKQGIKAYRFVYSAFEDGVVVNGESRELRTTKVAERLKAFAEERVLSNYELKKINQWYDPAILKNIKRIYNASGIEILCEIVEGQTLYMYPEQDLADREILFKTTYFNLIRQNRARVERRKDNLAIVTVTLNDDDPKRGGYPNFRKYAKTHVFNTYLSLSSLAYINVEDDIEVVRESLNKKEKLMTTSLEQAELYDNGDETTRRMQESAILDGIETTICFGEQSDIIKTELKKMAQKEFGYDVIPNVCTRQLK